MKKILMLAFVALAGTYVWGRVALGETGAMKFVTDMELAMSEGRADDVCDMMHDDLEVTITDSTSAEGSLEGGKEELCERARITSAALKIVPHTMSVQFDNVNVEREWLHPLTSEVFYLETRRFAVRGANVTIRTVSEDTMTLVQTLSGVKLRKLVADVSLAQ